jgi:hypothetical protein
VTTGKTTLSVSIHIPDKAVKRLVAQYGLPRREAAKGFWEGKADSMMAELVSHQLGGRIVEESYDSRRDVWVYKVFEMEVPSE